MSNRAEAGRQATNLALMMIRNLETEEDDGGALYATIAAAPNGLATLAQGYEILISALLTIVTDGNAEQRPAAIDALEKLVRQEMSTTRFETDMTFEEMIEGLDRFDDDGQEKR